MKEESVLSKIDECLQTLYASPSEKTVRTARELGNLIVEWRSICCNAILTNAVNISNDLMKSLKACGVIFQESERKDD